MLKYIYSYKYGDAASSVLSAINWVSVVVDVGEDAR